MRPCQPVEGLIHARFDIQEKYDEPWREIFRANMPAIPRRGELISIAGNPTIVTEVSWAIARDDGITYAFIQVVKTRDYKFEL